MHSQRTTNVLRADLPPVPDRMKRLRVDERGYPIPWFVSQVDGRPEFGVHRVDKLLRANRNRLCWICGNKAGRVAFILSTVHALLRTAREPPCHAECARFAVTTCPFLTSPAGVPGHGSLCAPGVTCLWTASAFRACFDHSGLRYELGNPIHLEFYAEKRTATREEALAAIHAVMLSALEVADREGLIRMRVDVVDAYRKMLPLLPAA